MRVRNLAVIVILVVAYLTVSAIPVSAAATLYVDAAGACGGNSPCYSHPQDAVNAANPGDTILVYPGTYDSRCFTSPKPPHWGINDQCAPALIVWKDNLLIEAIDPNPASTIIQSTHNVWSNKALPGGGGGGAIEHSTGCTYNAGTGNWDGTCVRPTAGTAPNGIAIIANGVTIDGFTIISTYGGDPGAVTANPNTAGVFIGGLFAGDSTRSGISGTTIENSIIRGHSGVRLWKAPDTTLENNVIDNNIALVDPTTPKGAGVSVWDGWCDNPNYPTGGGWCEGPNVGSTGFRVIGNVITSYLGAQGIAIGGYYVGPMDHSNLFIDENQITSSGIGVQFWSSIGTNKVMTCNNVVEVPEGYQKVAVLGGSTYDGPFGIDELCAAGAVGGSVQAASSFTLLSPWLAAVGVVGSAGILVVMKKRRI